MNNLQQQQLKTINEEQIINAILLNIRGVALYTACQQVQLYLNVFKTLEFRLNVDDLCVRIWEIYDSHKVDKEMLKTIKHWIINGR